MRVCSATKMDEIATANRLTWQRAVTDRTPDNPSRSQRPSLLPYMMQCCKVVKYSNYLNTKSAKKTFGKIFKYFFFKSSI